MKVETCPKCGDSFYSLAALREHEHTEHSLSWEQRALEAENKLGEWQDCARQKQEIIDSETALRKEAESRLDAAEKRIADQRETISQLTESVELWMERAGRGAP